MKKILKLSVIFCVVLSGLLMVWTKTARGNSEIGIDADKVVIETQSKLYVSNCARCHGANGKGDTQLGREMNIPDLTSSGVKGMSAAKMTRIIAKGDGDMPAFGKKLKASQITSLVKYVRSL